MAILSHRTQQKYRTTPPSKARYWLLRGELFCFVGGAKWRAAFFMTDASGNITATDAAYKDAKVTVCEQS